MTSAAGAFCLLLVGEQQFATYPLPPEGERVVGSSATADICLDDASLAPAHVLLRVGATFSITNLSSEDFPVRGLALPRGKTVSISTGEPVAIGSVMMMVQRRAEAIPRRIWPHGAFQVRVEEECIRAARYKTQFSVLRVHGASNEERSVQEAGLSNVLRLVDIMAMHSPGIYEVLLGETSIQGAKWVASMLEESLGARVGMASYPQDGLGGDELLAKAAAQLLTPEDKVPPRELPSWVPSSAMQHIDQLVGRLAASPLPVLILGERGVEKEKLAEQVHRRSPRASGPFMAVNGAALSESSLESELFGHERGDSTGGVGGKAGLLEAAEGGTVFLDEVGELPLSFQAKLLRVLETRQVFRVGSPQARPLHVRLVAATHRDLEQEVSAGTFLEALFFRLNGSSLVIPPLRERRSDIPSLATAFIAEACRKYGRSVPPVLSGEALDLCLRYRWPGNIPELRNIVERAVVLCGDGVIQNEHLPLEKMNASFAAYRAQHAPPAPVLEQPAPAAAGKEERNRSQLLQELQDMERKRIVDTLAACMGNQTVAAGKLGMSRRTLLNRMQTFQIPGPRKARGPQADPSGSQGTPGGDPSLL